MGVNIRLSPANRIDSDEFGLGNVLKIRDFPIEFVVVVYQPMTDVLDTNMVLHAEGHSGPRMYIPKKSAAATGSGVHSPLVVQGNLSCGTSSKWYDLTSRLTI